jgi:hypothetical protein
MANEESEEPDMDNDAFLQPTGPLGSKTSVTVGGTLLGDFESEEEAENALIKWQKEKSPDFFPAVWIVSDHGNMELTDVKWNTGKKEGSNNSNDNKYLKDYIDGKISLDELKSKDTRVSVIENSLADGGKFNKDVAKKLLDIWTDTWNDGEEGKQASLQSYKEGDKITHAPDSMEFADGEIISISNDSVEIVMDGAKETFTKDEFDKMVSNGEIYIKNKEEKKADRTEYPLTETVNDNWDTLKGGDYIFVPDGKDKPDLKGYNHLRLMGYRQKGDSFGTLYEVVEDLEASKKESARVVPIEESKETKEEEEAKKEEKPINTEIKDVEREVKQIEKEVKDVKKDISEVKKEVAPEKKDDTKGEKDVEKSKENKNKNEEEIIVEKKADSTNYRTKGTEDAKEFINNYEETIVEQLVEKGEASTDLYNDYGDGDSFIHESYTDKWYDLMESAQILDQLSDYEETDSGLWEGQEPRKAIATQAAFTYSSYVCSEIERAIEAINSEFSSLDLSQIPEEEHKSAAEEIVKKYE